MKRFKYTIHNLIGHPLMEIFTLLGMKKAAQKINDRTLPGDKNDTKVEEK